MPFKSRAQQRFMYSQHPEIARRWTDEMRGGKKASKMQREHPIKAANLPDRVGKRFGLGALKPAKVAGPILRTGVTRAGKVGVEFEHQGVKGWGSNESAARAAWENNRATGNGVSVGKRVTDADVAKGFLTQSTKPVLARTTAAAGRIVARPTGKAVAKADVSKLGMMGAGKLIPEIAGAAWKAGRTGNKARMSIGTMGALKQSSGLRALGTGAKMAGEHPVATGLGTGIVGGSVLGAGYAHRQVEKKANLCSRCKAPLERNAKRCMNCGKRVEVAKAFGGPVRRAKTYAEWSRMSGGLGPKTLRRAQVLTDQHGMTTPKGRRAFGVWQRDNNRKGSWRSATGRMADGQHVNLDDTRWESGVYGINTKQQRKMMTERIRRQNGQKTSPVKRRRGVANDLGISEHPNEFTDRVRRGQFQKAYGDPEDARYFRLGAGSAVLGGAGLTGLALGGRQIARDTQRERNRFKDLHDIDLPTKPNFDPATHKPGGPQEAKLRGWQKMERAKTVVAEAKNTKRLKGAAVIHGRAAGLIGGGAAALGGAEMLRRRATERRYN